MIETIARRALVVGWVVLGVLGALDHTLAERVFGRRFDLGLPHLKYGWVMFNHNPRTISVYRYTGADGTPHDLADLVATPAPGYARARLLVDALTEPQTLSEVCFRATRRTGETYDFVIDDYETDPGQSRLVGTRTLHCTTHGLTPR